MRDLIATASARRDRARRIGLGFVFLWFLMGGIAHFVATDTEVRLVPPCIPWPLAAVLVSGAFELMGALGLLFTATRRAAGIGLFALTICVTPVHIHMLQRPDLFTVPYWALVLRLPLQVALLALIAWSTFRTARAQGSDQAGGAGGVLQAEVFSTHAAVSRCADGLSTLAADRAIDNHTAAKQLAL